MNREPNEADAEMLDRLVDRLQAGGDASALRALLLAERPDLDELAACLEELEHLASHADAAPIAPIPPIDASPAAAPPAPVAELGVFRIEKEIGRGGMGVVYKAWQPELGRPVALKMILAGELASAEYVDRFRNESRALANVHHPNIVSIYEAGQIDGRFYFAMQFVEGPTLAERLKHGRLDPEQAARLAAAVARAAGSLHAHGVIHRDVKPSNILLDGDGTPYLSDFGLAKTLSADSGRTVSGAIVGTPCYMSPEQAAGKSKHVGPRSDVYSIGAVLYECLVGRPPFREETPLDTLVQVIEGEPVEPRRIDRAIPRDLELICLRCLEKNSEARYASADALADDLERWLKGEAIEARPTNWRSRIARWARREPALVWRLVMLAASFAIAQASYSFGNHATLALHAEVLGLLAAWAGLSFLCQRLIRDPERASPVRFVWSGLDVVLFGALVWLDDAFDTPLAIGFPLLAVASGLWFRTSLIWFTAAFAALTYVALWAASGAMPGPHWNHHVIFLLGIAIAAVVVSHQAARVRVLSRHYERRRL